MKFIRALLRLFYWGRKRPHKIKLSILLCEESFMDQYLVYTINLPLNESKDVVKREVHVSWNDQTGKTDTLPGTTTSYRVSGKKGDLISLYVIDEDDSGNRSEPSDLLDFTVIDTIAPKKPGTPYLVSVEEDPTIILENLAERVEKMSAKCCSNPGS